MVYCGYMHELPQVIVSHDLSWQFLLGPYWPLFVVAVLWSIILKGFALWYSARGGQKWWFVALLLVNTVGILEIVYLIWFRPKSFELEIEETPAQGSSAQA